MKNFWSSSVGTVAGQDLYNDLVTDGNENVYSVGTRTTGGNEDIIVAKMDRAGVVKWARQIDLSSSDEGRGIALRPDGNGIVITGSTFTSGKTRLFLARLNVSDGATVWERVINNGGSADSGHDVKVASDGSIVVAGSTTTLLGLAEYPVIARYNSNATSRIWNISLSGDGTARHLVLGDGRVYYAGERRNILNDLGVQIAGDAFVGYADLTNGNGNTYDYGDLNLTYERIHKLAYAGPNRVVFCGWQGITLLGQGAVPIYGLLDTTKSTPLAVAAGAGSDTVANDIAYDPLSGGIAVLRTGVPGGVPSVSVQTGDPDGSGGFDMQAPIELPGTTAYGHSVGFTPDSQWYAVYATSSGGRLALGDTNLKAINEMPRLSLGWSSVGIAASEHPPQEHNDRIVWAAGDTADGGKVTGNSYLIGSADTIRTDEDTAATQEVVRNDAALIIGERRAILSRPPRHGTVSFTGGTATYTPDANFHGSDLFTYRLQIGGLTIRYVPVSVTVLPVNDPPTVQDHDYNVSSRGYSLLNVLEGAQDIDGDRLTLSAVTQPSSGTAVIDGSRTKVIYRPAAGFSGTITFTYTVRDRGGALVSGTVTLHASA